MVAIAASSAMMADLIRKESRMPDSQFFAFFFVSKIEDFERAKVLSHQCIQEVRWHSRRTPEQMLPTSLSPTGITPVTHQMCAMCGTQEEFATLQVLIEKYGNPVVATIGTQLPDATRETIDAARDAWLASQNLKVIG
jgi:hypothetical protein